MVRPLVLLASLVTTACGGTQESAAQIAAPEEPREVAVDRGRVVASWEGGQVTYGELHDEIAPDLRMMEIQAKLDRYETLSQALEGVVMDRLLEAEAKARGVGTVEELLAVEIEQKVERPSEEEIASYYDLVSRQLGGMTLEEARPYLEQDLVRKKQVELYRGFVEGLKATAGVQTTLPYPDLPRIEVPIDEGDPVIGAADAPVTIIEFAEYQCPFCARVKPSLDRLLEEYDGKVRIVFKDFPLQNHGRALPAAVAARCAGDQGKYWEMNEQLLDNQHALSDADFVSYASAIGLDTTAFEECVTSGTHEQAVMDDLEQGRQAGVQATPSFLVNGIFLAGAQPYERFAALVDRELADSE